MAPAHSLKLHLEWADMYGSCRAHWINPNEQRGISDGLEIGWLFLFAKLKRVFSLSATGS
jgi:hypothetical protein